MRTKVELELIYHEMARRLLLKQSLPEVAQGMKLPLPRVQELTRREDFKEVLEALRDDTYSDTDKHLKETARNLREEIRRAAEDSFDTLQELLYAAKGEGTKVKIAQDMLDRAGYGAEEDRPQVHIAINTTDARVLTETIRAEQEAQQRLKGVERLITRASDFAHPTDLKRGTNTSESADRESSAEGS